MPKTIGSYTVRVECRNCGERERIDIQKGKEIAATACPNCGCRTLRKMLFA